VFHNFDNFVHVCVTLDATSDFEVDSPQNPNDRHGRCV
jgi:hypothetical protein